MQNRHPFKKKVRRSGLFYKGILEVNLVRFFDGSWLPCSDSLFNSLKTGKKAEFALDVIALEDPAALTVPNYIAEGLAWLESQLRKRQMEVIEADPKAAELEA